MNSKLIFLLIFGLTLAENNIINNKTDSQLKKQSDIVTTQLPSTVDNTTDAMTNSSVIEFFGNEAENNTKTDDRVNNSSEKIDSKKINNKNKNSKRFKLKNYNRDPLQLRAQQQNPFLSGPPGLRGPRRPGGGIDPQLALLLQNNPRLRVLAEQNPEIAQQIFRNPRLLRDPRIASNL